MSFHSGKQGKVVAGGQDLAILSWSGEFRAERIDVTHTGSGGQSQFLAGVQRGDIQFEALWDDAHLPDADPPNLVEGELVALELHCGGSGKTFAGDLFVESVRYESAVRGRVTYRCEGSFSGNYSRPHD